jgi:DUF4097 and DUF4098 domain-containing protein YvlB
MIGKYQRSERSPFRQHIKLRAIVFSPAIFLPLVILALAATVFAQQAGPPATGELSVFRDSRFVLLPSAQDLMDSLWRAEKSGQEITLETFGQSSRQAMLLYQKALGRYLEELPCVQDADLTWQRWWEDFDRQQEHYWMMWQARFGKLFVHHLQSIWTDAYSHRLEKTISLSGRPTFSLAHECGDVAITGSSKATVQLVAEIKIIAASRADAQKYAQQIDFAVTQENSILKTTILLPTARPETVQGVSIDLDVELPRDCPLLVESYFGNIRVLGMTKGLRAKSSHGSLEVRECKGDLDLANRQGQIKVTQGEGMLSVETSFDPIFVAEFLGDVFASNKFGPVIIEGVCGSVQIENSAGLIKAVDIDGDVTVSNRLGQVVVQGVAGDLSVDNAGAPVNIAGVLGQTHIESKQGKICAEKLRGDVIIFNQNGDIDLALDEIRQNLYRLDTSFGVVRLNFPPSPSATIRAQTFCGTIDSDFPLEITRVGTTQMARGKLGQGKTLIQLDAKNSNIYLISSKR